MPIPYASLCLRRILSAVALFASFALASCGGAADSGGGSTTTPPSTNAYAAAYQKATFASGVTVTYPSSCAMSISATGAPYQHATYYLTPASSGQTVVATTASGIQLAVSPYAGSGLSNFKTLTATFNICPTKATSTTTAGMGAIGFIFAGTSLFNPYEATGTVALGDNASYTFTVSGTTYTASFLDTCNQHTNQTSTWHFHGAPTCWTGQVDGASGASHIIGIALDGFPIYGGRDVNGKVVDASTLDSCNGITSATPEFPSGAYHYVLPIDANGNALTTKQSSINCYSGTASGVLSAQMKALACKMPMLLASGKMRLPDGREVTRTEADVWIREQAMPDMKMGGVQMASGERRAGVPPPHPRALVFEIRSLQTIMPIKSSRQRLYRQSIRFREFRRCIRADAEQSQLKRSRRPVNRIAADAEKCANFSKQKSPVFTRVLRAPSACGMLTAFSATNALAIKYGKQGRLGQICRGVLPMLNPCKDRTRLPPPSPRQAA